MKTNPFIEKAELRKRQRKIAERNYRELAALLRRYANEESEARERIRKRTEEARKVLESLPT